MFIGLPVLRKNIKYKRVGLPLFFFFLGLAFWGFLGLAGFLFFLTLAFLGFLGLVFAGFLGFFGAFATAFLFGSGVLISERGEPLRWSFHNSG